MVWRHCLFYLFGYLTDCCFSCVTSYPWSNAYSFEWLDESYLKHSLFTTHHDWIACLVRYVIAWCRSLFSFIFLLRNSSVHSFIHFLIQTHIRTLGIQLTHHPTLLLHFLDKTKATSSFDIIIWFTDLLWIHYWIFCRWWQWQWISWRQRWHFQKRILFSVRVQLYFHFLFAFRFIFA